MWNKTLSSSYMFQWKVIWTEYFAGFLVDIHVISHSQSNSEIYEVAFLTAHTGFPKRWSRRMNTVSKSVEVFQHCKSYTLLNCACPTDNTLLSRVAGVLLPLIATVFKIEPVTTILISSSLQDKIGRPAGGVGTPGKIG